MTNLTKEELTKWFNDMCKQCEELSGKTDSLSNAIRAYNVMQMTMIMNELRRRDR